MRSCRPCCILAVAALAACAGARPAPRLPATPLAAPVTVAAEARARADADRAPAMPGAPSPFVADPQVRLLYRMAWTEPQAPVVESAAPAAAAPPPGWSDPAYVVPAAAAPRRRAPFVPVGTVLGAGIGGALSTRSHRAEGALLGAGIGLLFDLQRSAW
jgi:hypothetical protein